MADVEYIIKVQNELIKTGDTHVPTEESATPEQTTKKLTKEASNEASESVSKVVAIQMGKQALQYGIQNYGNLTGDYVTQANISAGLQVAGLVAMASQGPVGIAAAAVSLGTQALSYSIDMNKRNREAQFLRERVGMASIYGGR